MDGPKNHATAEWNDALLFEVAVDPFQQIAISGKEEGRAAGLRDGYQEGVNIGRSKGWEIGLELGYIHDFAEGILNGYHQRLENRVQQKEQVSNTSQSLQHSQKSEPQHKPAHRTSHRLERCLTLARDLVKMTNKFPDPSLLVSQHHQDSGLHSANESAKEGGSCETASDSECCNDNLNECTEKSSSTSCCKNSPRMDSEVGSHDDDVNSKAADSLNVRKNEPSRVPNPEAMLDVSASIERIRAKFKLLCVLLKTNHSFELKKVLELGNGTRMDSMDIRGNDESASMKDKGQTIDTGLKNLVQGFEDRESNVRGNAIGNLQGKDPSRIESDW